MQNQLILLVGPPGSGKTTYSKPFLDHIYINQDSQGKDGHFNLFREAIKNKKNIIVDRMNFSFEQRNRYLSLAKESNYNITIVVFHESYDTCLKRCLERKNHETIQNEKNARSALQTFFIRYDRVENKEADCVLQLWPEGTKDKAIVVDLDGTLCNITHRLHWVNTDVNKKDWKRFFSSLNEDSVNEWCRDIIYKFSDTHKIIYCSGRPDDYRKQTEMWLKENSLSTHDLYMRRRGDFRSDHIIKEILLDFEILTRFDPYFVIDDRKQVVDMWRRRGVTTLQCDEGDF